MGKQFYDLDEAKAKLGLSEEELKALVRDGQLREFRDAGKIRYKAGDVDALVQNLGSLSGSLGTESGELILEPSEESSMGLTGSDMLTLDEADREGADDTAVMDDSQEDTVITSVGISVFDDEELSEADPRAKTVLSDEPGTPAGSSAGTSAGSGTGSGFNLEMSSTGTGSGLLDLSREADDTSLGSELLDEIYSADQESGASASASPSASGIGEGTRAGLGGSGTAAAEQSADLTVSDELASPAPQRVVTVVIEESEGGPIEAGLTGALLGAILVLGIAGVAVAANVQNVMPNLLTKITQQMPLFAGVFVGVPVLLFVVGLLIGRRH
jgi:hypothetical protein